MIKTKCLEEVFTLAKAQSSDLPNRLLRFSAVSAWLRPAPVCWSQREGIMPKTFLNISDNVCVL